MLDSSFFAVEKRTRADLLTKMLAEIQLLQRDVAW
jgi:hypothetical protein